MKQRRILLVGYQDQDNLGLRYLSSRLLADGHHTRIVSFGTDPGDMLDIVRRERPDLIGFSLIFQFMVPEFGTVIRALRAADISAHITIGGHYASFEPEELLRRIPELDSVVRFEGEETLADLVAHVDEPAAWRAVAGIAYLDGGKPVCTAARKGTSDIDRLPWPDRRDLNHRTQALPTASVLGSRGCPWKCSFCSIITFYEGNGTKGRRRRNPEDVVDEVDDLVNARGARLLLFQDDDFLAGGKAAQEWALAVGRGFIKRGLHEQMRFKLSCRSDEVRVDLLAPLVQAGLCHVYLGVESGDVTDLANLNKLMQPTAHIEAGRVLRELDLSFDFGFMLLEPWSTLDTARNNLEFLRTFTSDGWVVAGFCRTLPYVGTPLERRLRQEGRLDGASLDAEYRFLDPRVDLLWDFCLIAFMGRNHGADNTWNLLRGLLFDSHLNHPDRPRDDEYDAAIRAIAQASNGVMLDVLDNAIDLIATNSVDTVKHPDLLALARLARDEDHLIRRQLADMRAPIGRHAELFR